MEGYTQKILELVGMSDCKPLSHMGETNLKEEKGEQDWDEPLDAWTHYLYRAFVGKVNFLSRLRVDLLYATKELSRHLQQPRVRDWARLKKVARYLRGTEDMEVDFIMDKIPDILDVYADSDHASDRETRKSTSCVVACWGQTILSAFSKTQGTIATSSGEAEVYALGAACSEGLYLQTILSELGYEVRLNLHTDSTTAKRVAQRKGLGTMKHMDVKFLFIQDIVLKKKAYVYKVHTDVNLSDIGTKWHTSTRLETLRSLVYHKGMMRKKEKNDRDKQVNFVGAITEKRNDDAQETMMTTTWWRS